MSVRARCFFAARGGIDGQVAFSRYEDGKVRRFGAGEFVF